MGNKRMYAEPWRVLKSTGKVSMKIVGKKMTRATVDKYAKTYRKAMQKEKWMDDRFRVMHPTARILSTINYDTATINFVLESNDFGGVKEEDFNV